MTREDLFKIAKPILFNTEMVKKIVENKKTVTRRICKDGNAFTVPDMDYYDAEKRTYAVHNYANTEHTEKLSIAERKCPICPDDILYVRETWRVGSWDIKNQMIAFDYKDGSCGELVFIHDRELFNRLVNNSREDARRAGCEYNGIDFIWKKGASPCKWHPSIHMPKEAARIFLRVKDVRVERLRDMTEDDAIKEGVNETFPPLAIDEFRDLWNSTLGRKDTPEYYCNCWNGNPYVWVIEFFKIKLEEI